MSDEPVWTGKRKCRWCGKEYRWPVGSVSKGCPDCQPQLIPRDAK